MKRIILILTLLVAFAGWNLAGENGKENNPKIKFNKKVHDYGTIYQNGDGNCQFEFTNTGDAPLVLTAVRSSCGCTVPKWTREPIMPGESGTIKVKYDTRRLGAINKQITVRSNAENGVVVLKIRGKVIPEPQGAPQKTKSDIQ